MCIALRLCTTLGHSFHSMHRICTFLCIAPGHAHGLCIDTGAILILHADTCSGHGRHKRMQGARHTLIFPFCISHVIAFTASTQVTDPSVIGNSYDVEMILPGPWTRTSLSTPLSGRISTSFLRKRSQTLFAIRMPRMYRSHSVTMVSTQSSSFMTTVQIRLKSIMTGWVSAI